MDLFVAMSDVSVLMVTALVLLLATVAAWWAVGHRTPRGRQGDKQKIRKRPGVHARGARKSRGAPVAPRPSRARLTPPEHPDAPLSPLSSPCSCGRCVTVAKELQELMLLLWARHGTSAALYAGMWQALRARLKELLKRGHLACCASASCSRRLRPCKRLLPATMAIPGRACPPSRMAFHQRSSVHRGTSGRQRATVIPGASTASDGLPPSKTLAAPLDRFPPSNSLPPSENLPVVEKPSPSENLPIVETPSPSEILPTATVPSDSPQPLKILALQSCFLPTEFLPPSQSITPGSLPASHSDTPGTLQPSQSATPASLPPSQELSNPCQPADTEELPDSSPCSLALMDSKDMGTSLSMARARESPEAEMGAQLDQGKHCQEQVAEPQVFSSHQGPPQSCQDAVAVPAGNSPCLVEEKVPRRPRRFTGLQEAAPRRAPRTRHAFPVTGEMI